MDNPLRCSACGRPQPADGLNAFEILGLPAAFDLDPELVRERYFALARMLHPDRAVAQQADSGDAGLRANAMLNQAFETLANPVTRAACLLELSGGPTAVDDKHVPQEVLNAALMIRDEIEEAAAAGDERALLELRTRVAALLARSESQIAALARRLPGTEPQRRTLRHELNSIRYYQRLAEQM
jgi:molecular chaperone HscB